MGSAGFDRTRGPLAAPLGAGLRPLRDRRETRDTCVSSACGSPLSAGPSGVTGARWARNSVPRFHLTWGTGPEVVRVFREPVLAAERRGLVRFAFRHRVDELIVEGAVIGVAASCWSRRRWSGVASSASRSASSSPRPRGPRLHAAGSATTTSWSAATGRSTGSALRPPHDLGRARLRRRPDAGRSPRRAGAQRHQPRPDVALRRGAAQLEPDLARPRHPDPPGPSSLWLDATGTRLAAAALPRIRHPAARSNDIMKTGHDYSWFVLNQGSSRRSSRCPAPSRTPTSPARTRELSAARAGRQEGATATGRGVQGSTAPTSSSGPP